MKLSRLATGTCISLILMGTLAFGSVLAHAATDSQDNTKGIRSSEITAAGSSDEALLLDDNGITPEQAIQNLVEAENAADWQKVYSELSAYTAWCYEYVRADLASRAPKYSDFKVTRTDFIQLDNRKYARVEVSYNLEFKDRATGESKTINREGDWWTVFTEDGAWKVEYMNGTPGGSYTASTLPDLDVVLDFKSQKSIHSIIRFSA